MRGVSARPRTRVFRWATYVHRVGDMTCPSCQRAPNHPRPVLHGPCGGLIHEEVPEPDPIVQGPPWPIVSYRCDVCRERAPEPACEAPIYLPHHVRATA